MKSAKVIKRLFRTLSNKSLLPFAVHSYRIDFTGIQSAFFIKVHSEKSRALAVAALDQVVL